MTQILFQPILLQQFILTYDERNLEEKKNTATYK